MLTATKDLRTLPEAFTDEWATEIAQAALMYLSRHYVAGADLSVLGPWEDRVTAAAVAEDPRAYVRAGLRAFDVARDYFGQAERGVSA